MNVRDIINYCCKKIEEIIAKGEFSELQSEEKDLRYARNFTF